MFAAPSAQSSSACFTPVSAATLASIPAFSFSHTKGIAPQKVGLTSANAAAIVVMSGTTVTWVPMTSWI